MSTVKVRASQELSGTSAHRVGPTWSCCCGPLASDLTEPRTQSKAEEQEVGWVGGLEIRDLLLAYRWGGSGVQASWFTKADAGVTLPQTQPSRGTEEAVVPGVWAWSVSNLQRPLPSGNPGAVLKRENRVGSVFGVLLCWMTVNASRSWGDRRVSGGESRVGLSGGARGKRSSWREKGRYPGLRSPGPPSGALILATWLTQKTKPLKHDLLCLELFWLELQKSQFLS